MKRKGKIAGAADYILPVGIIGIAVFALYKMGIFNGTFTGTGSNNAASSAVTAATAQSAWSASNATTPQSLPDTTLNSMIQTMLSDAQENTSAFSGSSYQEDVVNQVSLLNNITDLYRLYMLWGTRAVPTTDFGSLCNLIDVDCSQLDLGAFLHVTLSSDQLAEVNQDLAGNGISYVFT